MSDDTRTAATATGTSPAGSTPPAAKAPAAPAKPAPLEAPTDEGRDNFPRLLEAAGSYLGPDDLDKVTRAYRYAAKQHAGVKRKSGEPYICHPVEVALILAENLHSDVDVLCAGLLHDTVEDTDTTLEQLTDMFGPQVAELVDGVTKLTNIEVDSLSEQQALNLRKLFLAMAKDIRVIIIKLADRLHNMRTLMAIPEDRRIFKAHETMEIYAPLANRLGISSIKWELEDLSFCYLEPAKYRQIARMVSETREQREHYLDEVIGMLRGELDRAGIKGYRIMGRPKHLYSIYQKMKNRGKDFSEIYDLIALRVITTNVRDCYAAVGAVHAQWHPMPGRFKDYISMPKFNMYQSLHTTVIGPAGRPLEIQIRTEEMHQQAEYGIAAHWLYKQAGNSEGNKQTSAQKLDDQLALLGRTLEWTQQDDMSDPQEFLNALKIDLFDTEVFVFTPKGEVVILRAGSTPLDFAYSVHTEVGNHCVGAKVNGSVVPLSYELQMGDRVEILTQNNASPSRDWLSIVKTPSARSKIRSFFAKMTKADDAAAGRDEVARELRKQGLGIATPRTTRAMAKVAPILGFASPDDLFVSVANGKTSPRLVANKVSAQLEGATNSQAEAEKRALASLTTAGSLMTMTPPRIARPTTAQRREAAKRTNNGIVVEGSDTELPVRLARCCNPVMGDDIVGFITRGRGVSVHRADCPNVSSLQKSEGRMIGVRWDSGRASLFQVEIVIEAVDRTRLLTDITVVISDQGGNILSSGTRTDRSGISNMRFLIELGDIGRLNAMLSLLQQVDGVLDARRALPGESGEGKGRGKHHSH
ncbi:MAG: bifunctional (p)ppGpp synthetase/guanosine-3',5'-bis(diphosphate) 3'-pyrophosphohydrolase [Coriobacteriia bacterium]|nr:bifunctional (p)ppGpp synthetase/guanosine-3',5'-bis(diphosphate) 3'-pyrophosphohydrolase [Coriobacteriia bacterium]